MFGLGGHVHGGVGHRLLHGVDGGCGILHQRVGHGSGERVADLGGIQRRGVIGVGEQLRCHAVLAGVAPTLRVHEQRAAEGRHHEQDDDDEDLQTHVAALAIALGNALGPLLQLLVGGAEEAIIARCRAVLAGIGGVGVAVIVRVGLLSGIRILLGIHSGAVSRHIDAGKVRRIGGRCATGNRNRGHDLGDLGRALGDGGHRALVIDACGVGQEVRLVGDGLLEGVDGLLHLAGCDVGLAEVGVQAVAHLGLHVELQGAFVGRHRIGGAVERHEAHAQVQQGLGGIGVGLVKGGVAERHTGLGGLAHLQKRVAHARVGLVGGIVLRIGSGRLEVGNGILVVVQGGVGHAQVVMHAAAGVVGLVGHGLAVGLDCLVGLLELHQAVAHLVVQLAHLAGGEGAGLVLQALLVSLQGALEVLLRISCAGLLE